jgi:tRNA pseudouridine55 synthase
VEIGRFDLIQHGGAKTVFEIECGKGTYVRSLARDMGRDLQCFGHVAELRRIQVEPFTADDLVTVAELEGALEGRDSDDRFSLIDDLLVETAAALEFLPQVAVTDEAATRIRLGNAVIVRGRDAPVQAEEACATARGKLIAIGAIEAGMFKPKRVFAG